MIKTLATPGKRPEFGAHMQSHCGYATAVLGTGPLPCRPVTSGRDRAALFFKALNAVLDGHPPCQGLRPVARVSHPRGGACHPSEPYFQPTAAVLS